MDPEILADRVHFAILVDQPIVAGGLVELPNASPFDRDFLVSQ